ncbi:hypothetical protein TIFTF001_055035 [Ficus carica]|uniref:Uncharacterized protein n=1 Tax=Ficus carica TaxID=3494 RepID=A0AA88JJ48_FICCA|nr:hypothetical protein TIFTF001_055032 [Ficus carica]GMN74706.1 hypothetical protein TIFTF001_055035 [Ficus carica]
MRQKHGAEQSFSKPSWSHGKYGKNTERNRVSENLHGSRSFHDGYRKPSWKIMLPRRFSITFVESCNFHDSHRKPSWKTMLP